MPPKPAKLSSAPLILLALGELGGGAGSMAGLDDFRALNMIPGFYDSAWSHPVQPGNPWIPSKGGLYDL